MRYLRVFTRSRPAVLILALSILSACNDKIVVGPNVIGGPPSTVDVTFCAAEAPVWVASRCQQYEADRWRVRDQLHAQRHPYSVSTAL